MPLLKRKAVEDLVPGRETLYSQAGNVATAGTLVTDNLVQRLLRHRTPVVTVILPSREESSAGKGTDLVEGFVREKEGLPFQQERARLFEHVKKLYKPYGELVNRSFQGKLGARLMKADFLLERKPEPMYKPGILSGSLGIYGTSEANGQFNDRKAIVESLEGIYDLLESRDSPGRLFLDSVRLCAIYDSESKDRVRVIDPGNALAWHATDTAILTLAALQDLSRRRREAGLPESTEEFEKAKTQSSSHHSVSVRADRFHYPRATVIEAALGCVLHALGYAHLSVNRLVARRPLLDDSPVSAEALKTIRRSQFAVRNLFEERADLSAIAKKVIFRMHQYPDGTGYPLQDEGSEAAIPEYARMAQIAADWDELVNPVLLPHPMGRAEAIARLSRLAGDHRPGGRSARYDRVLLDDFLRILKPWAEGERVDLHLGGQRSKKYYCGFVRGYASAESLLPEVCVLKNHQAGEAYAFGRVVFDLAGSRVLLLDEAGKVGASISGTQAEERDAKGDYRVKNAKIREMGKQLPELVCLDDIKDAWSPAEYFDPVYEVSRRPTAISRGR